MTWGSWGRTWRWWTTGCAGPGCTAPTLGLLLVAGRSEQLVRYPLTASSAPVAVADWSSLPADARAVLPPADRIAAALDTSTLPGADTEDPDR